MSVAMEICGACGREFETIEETFSHKCDAVKHHRREVGTVASPEHGDGTGTGAGQPSGRSATDKQVRYLQFLISATQPSEAADEAEQLLASYKPGLPLMHLVSKQINKLRSLADKQPPKPRQEPKPRVDAVPDGLYLYEGSVVKVQRSKAGHAYATQLNAAQHRFEYLGAAPLRTLTLDDALTLEQAAEFGHRYGVCACCGALLTNPESIERGIGPICAGRFAG